jgi:hypothetical protein
MQSEEPYYPYLQFMDLNNRKWITGRDFFDGINAVGA